MDELNEFLEAPGTVVRARCMYCGTRFETPGEIRLHLGNCQPKFWFWYRNHYPGAFAGLGLSAGALLGHFNFTLATVIVGVVLAVTGWGMIPRKHRERG